MGLVQGSTCSRWVTLESPIPSWAGWVPVPALPPPVPKLPPHPRAAPHVLQPGGLEAPRGIREAELGGPSSQLKAQFNLKPCTCHLHAVTRKHTVCTNAQGPRLAWAGVKRRGQWRQLGWVCVGGASLPDSLWGQEGGQRVLTRGCLQGPQSSALQRRPSPCRLPSGRPLPCPECRPAFGLTRRSCSRFSMGSSRAPRRTLGPLLLGPPSPFFACWFALCLPQWAFYRVPTSGARSHTALRPGKGSWSRLT